MVRRQSISKGDVLLWWPPGQNTPDYHLMIEKNFCDKGMDEWHTILLNTGEREDVSVSSENYINWWPHE